jgi:hypothetical protein
MVTEAELFLQAQNNLALAQMVVIVELFAIILVIVFCLPFLWVVMNKLMGRKTIVAIVDKAHNITLKPGYTLKNGMLRKGADFYYKKYRGTFFLNRLPLEFIGLDSAYVQSPTVNVFIQSLIDAGYKTHQNFNNAMTTYNPATVRDSLKDKYTDDEIQDLLYLRNPLQLTRGSEVYAPLFSNLPLDVLSEYGSEHMPTNINSYVSDRMIFNESPIEESFLDKYGTYIMLALLIIVGGAIAYAIVNSVK